MTDKETALYRHFDAEGVLLYVGITLNWRNRTWQHKKTAHWFRDIAEIKIEWFDKRNEAIEAERDAILNELPKYNIQLRYTEPKKAKEDRADEAKMEIIRQVLFSPIYTLEGAAEVLGASVSHIKKMITVGELGAVVKSRHERTLNGVTRTNTRWMVTGWQIIDFIENMERSAAWTSKN